jgi:hypothetical protein
MFLGFGRLDRYDSHYGLHFYVLGEGEHRLLSAGLSQMAADTLLSAAVVVYTERLSAGDYAVSETACPEGFSKATAPLR